jgi:hypothetical protein
MRGFATLLILGGLLAIPALAQNPGADQGPPNETPPYPCLYCDSGYPPPPPLIIQSPPKVTTYSGPAQTCPNINGKPLYRIAIPPDRPDRRGKMLSTYQDNLLVTHDYWYTEETLNFVTIQEERIETPINSIDRALTRQLNRECGVNFQLPGSPDRAH